MWLLIGKTALIYVVVNIAMRCMGKRQVGELSTSEVIVAFLISEVASAPLSNPEVCVWMNMIAIFVLVGMEFLYSYLSMKWPFFAIDDGDLDAYKSDKGMYLVIQ